MEDQTLCVVLSSSSLATKTSKVRKEIETALKKIVGKEENGSNQNFLHFPLFFSKGFFLHVVKKV